MALVDTVSNTDELNGIIRRHKLDIPKFKIGDKITFKKNAEKISDERVVIQKVWRNEHTILAKSKSLKVIAKFKYDAGEPWWSSVENEHGIRLFVLDEVLLHKSVRYMYSPKIILKNI